jgi:hypothetical protein
MLFIACGAHLQADNGSIVKELMITERRFRARKTKEAEKLSLNEKLPLPA